MASGKCRICIIILITVASVKCTPMYIRRTGHDSLTNRLLSLWSMGDVSEDRKINDNIKSTGDSLKNVLEFLTNKASGTNKKIPNAAREGLNALLLGAAKTPKPINLTSQMPMEAVMKYFQDMDITTKVCKLHTICELMTEPQASYGVFGELISYVFGNENPDPSILGSLDKDAYKDYYQAAQNGHHMNDCSVLYRNCTSSSKEYIKLINL